MTKYIIRRFVYMIISLIAMSIVAFVIINLPPGNYVEIYINQLQASGTIVDESMELALKRQYGFGQPLYLRYLKWVAGMFRGSFGRSFVFNRPVIDLVLSKLPFTLLLALGSVLFTYVVAIPIGIFSATHQYSIGDNTATFFGFLGLAIPDFLLGLSLMYLLFQYFGFDPGGLFSPEYADAPLSLGKVVDLLKHLIVPIVVIGTAGTAGLIRTMRATLLDELGKNYVITARSKGVSERTLLFKYPVRIAINPIISTMGWIFPLIISGGAIVAIVLNLPTLGPMLFTGLMSQDMYLAGTVVLFQTFLAILGTFVSDLLLVWSDPRISYD